MLQMMWWIVFQKNILLPAISDHHIANKNLLSLIYFKSKSQKCIKCTSVIKCTNSTMQLNLFIYRYGTRNLQKITFWYNISYFNFQTWSSFLYNAQTLSDLQVVMQAILVENEL